MTSGMTIVALGLAQEASDLFDTLDPVAGREPKLQLVKAYAVYSLDRFDQVLGYLREATIRETELSSDDRWFLEEARASCEYRLGRISREDYLANEERLGSERPGVSSLLHRLEVLRHRHLSAKDSSERGVLEEELHQLVSEIQGFAGGFPVLGVNARVVEVYASGHHLVSDFIHSMGIQQSRIQMGVHAGPEEALAEGRAFRARWDAWHAGAEQTIDAAESALHPLLAAEAQYVRALVMSAYLVQLRAF